MAKKLQENASSTPRDNPLKRVAVLGATGYAGIELLRLLRYHSFIKVTAVTADKNAGQALDEVVPSLNGCYTLNCRKIEELYDSDFDVIFLALPHKQSVAEASRFLKPKTLLIDISGAFRIKDTAVFKKWYDFETSAELSKAAVYGLPELKRNNIRQAKLIANPGCYPTGAIIPLAPLLRKGIIKNRGIIIDAKSGATGAGRSAMQELHFSEVNEGFRAYKPAAHRHIPEIEQELSEIVAGTGITFVPHLVPMNRGIFTTIYAVAHRKALYQSELEDALLETYMNEPFVRIIKFPHLPNVNAVKGSNYIDIAVRYDKENSIVVLFSAIDNLVKGAAGQAVQNMNIAMDFQEKEGLSELPLFP